MASHGIRLDDPDVVEAVACELAEHPRDGRLVDLEGQQVGLRPSLCHRDQRLASAGPDLDDQLRITPERLHQIQRGGRVDGGGGVHREVRQRTKRSR